MCFNGSSLHNSDSYSSSVFYLEVKSIGSVQRGFAPEQDVTEVGFLPVRPRG